MGSVAVTTSIDVGLTSAVRRWRTELLGATADCAVASASTVVPSWARLAVAETSPVTETVTDSARLRTRVAISSRLIPETSIPATVVRGAATSA